jgi:hypothetical protein
MGNEQSSVAALSPEEIQALLGSDKPQDAKQLGMYLLQSSEQPDHFISQGLDLVLLNLMRKAIHGEEEELTGWCLHSMANVMLNSKVGLGHFARQKDSCALVLDGLRMSNTSENGEVQLLAVACCDALAGHAVSGELILDMGGINLLVDCYQATTEMRLRATCLSTFTTIAEHNPQNKGLPLLAAVVSPFITATFLDVADFNAEPSLWAELFALTAILLTLEPSEQSFSDSDIQTITEVLCTLLPSHHPEDGMPVESESDQGLVHWNQPRHMPDEHTVACYWFLWAHILVVSTATNEGKGSMGIPAPTLQDALHWELTEGAKHCPSELRLTRTTYSLQATLALLSRMSAQERAALFLPSQELAAPWFSLLTQHVLPVTEDNGLISTLAIHALFLLLTVTPTVEEKEGYWHAPAFIEAVLSLSQVLIGSVGWCLHSLNHTNDPGDEVTVGGDGPADIHPSAVALCQVAAAGVLHLWREVGSSWHHLPLPVQEALTEGLSALALLMAVEPSLWQTHFTGPVALVCDHHQSKGRGREKEYEYENALSRGLAICTRQLPLRAEAATSQSPSPHLSSALRIQRRGSVLEVFRHSWNAWLSWGDQEDSPISSLLLISSTSTSSPLPLNDVKDDWVALQQCWQVGMRLLSLPREQGETATTSLATTSSLDLLASSFALNHRQTQLLSLAALYAKCVRGHHHRGGEEEESQVESQKESEHGRSWSLSPLHLEAIAHTQVEADQSIAPFFLAALLTTAPIALLKEVPLSQASLPMLAHMLQCHPPFLSAFLPHLEGMEADDQKEAEQEDNGDNDQDEEEKESKDDDAEEADIRGKMDVWAHVRQHLMEPGLIDEHYQGYPSHDIVSVEAAVALIHQHHLIAAVALIPRFHEMEEQEECAEACLEEYAPSRGCGKNQEKDNLPGRLQQAVWVLLSDIWTPERHADTAASLAEMRSLGDGSSGFLLPLPSLWTSALDGAAIAAVLQEGGEKEDMTATTATTSPPPPKTKTKAQGQRQERWWAALTRGVLLRGKGSKDWLPLTSEGRQRCLQQALATQATPPTAMQTLTLLTLGEYCLNDHDHIPLTPAAQGLLFSAALATLPAGRGLTSRPLILSKASHLMMLLCAMDGSVEAFLQSLPPLAPLSPSTKTVDTVHSESVSVSVSDLGEISPLGVILADLAQALTPGNAPALVVGAGTLLARLLLLLQEEDDTQSVSGTPLLRTYLHSLPSAQILILWRALVRVGSTTAAHEASMACRFVLMSLLPLLLAASTSTSTLTTPSAAAETKGRAQLAVQSIPLAIHVGRQAVKASQKAASTGLLLLGENLGADIFGPAVVTAGAVQLLESLAEQWEDAAGALGHMGRWRGQADVEKEAFAAMMAQMGMDPSLQLDAMGTGNEAAEMMGAMAGLNMLNQMFGGVGSHGAEDIFGGDAELSSLMAQMMGGGVEQKAAPQPGGVSMEVLDDDEEEEDEEEEEQEADMWGQAPSRLGASLHSTHSHGAEQGALLEVLSDSEEEDADVIELTTPGSRQ